jgi:acetyl esterase
MAIDAAMTAILERAKNNPVPSYQTMPINEARTTFIRLAGYWNQSPEPMAQVEDLLIQTPECAIPARIYTPEGAQADGPVLIYLHGGGWTFGSVETHDNAVRRLAVESRIHILSIDYRLAPEHAFPAGHTDVLETIRFVENGGLGRRFRPATLPCRVIQPVQIWLWGRCWPVQSRVCPRSAPPLCSMAAMRPTMKPPAIAGSGMAATC